MGVMCGLVVISIVLLASPLSFMMDRPVEKAAWLALELPLPREWAEPDTARVDTDDEPAALPRFEEPLATGLGR